MENEPQTSGASMRPMLLEDISLGICSVQKRLYKVDHAAHLLNYANESRMEGKHNDIRLCAGNRKIPANRMVLSCYSTYFEAMFQSNMKEVYESDVAIHGVDGDALQSIVDFIYTGNISVDGDNVCKLLAISDFMGMNNVKSICFKFMLEELNIENGLLMFMLAVHYMQVDCIDFFVQFLETNIIGIMKSNIFKILTFNELMMFRSTQYRKMLLPITVYRFITAWMKLDTANHLHSLSDLLQMVDFDSIPLDFLEVIVGKEYVLFNCPNYARLSSAISCKRAKVVSDACRVISIGGVHTLKTVMEVYPTYNTKEILPMLPLGRTSGCSVVLNGYVYYVGGKTTRLCRGVIHQDVIVSRVDRMKLDERPVQWSEVASMNEKRHVMGGCVMFGFIFVVGGFRDGECLSSGEYYMPSFNKWNPIAPLKEAKSGNALVSCGGYLYCMGGNRGQRYLQNVERFDFFANVWKDAAPMLTPRAWFAAVAIGDVVYAIGGQSNDHVWLKSVEMYDTKTEEWTFVGEMNMPRCGVSASVINGLIYVSGGANGRDVCKNSECYDPTTDRWSFVGKRFINAHFHHATVVV